MQKFCVHCGSELKEEQEVCLGCGVLVKDNIQEKNIQNTVKTPKSNGGTYKLVTGILMILLSLCLLAASLDAYEDEVLLTLMLPGFLGLIAGILNVCSSSNHNLLKPAAILFFISAGINFLGIFDISIFSILTIVFGILNLVYCQKS